MAAAKCHESGLLFIHLLVTLRQCAVSTCQIVARAVGLRRDPIGKTSPKASAVAAATPGAVAASSGTSKKVLPPWLGPATSRSTVFSVWRSVLTRFGSSLIVCFNSGLSRIPSTETSVCSTETRPARPEGGGTIESASRAPSRVRSALQQGPESATASATRLRD